MILSIKSNLVNHLPSVFVVFKTAARVLRLWRVAVHMFENILWEYLFGLLKLAEGSRLGNFKVM